MKPQDTRRAGLLAAARKAGAEALRYYRLQEGRAPTEETKRDRAIATALWALADWCKAQARLPKHDTRLKKPLDTP